MEYVICHYHEIALKGKNRKFFEEKLIENIKRSLETVYFEFVKRISGRIIIKLTEQGFGNKVKIKKSLKNVFGMAYFAFAEDCEQELKAIKEKAFDFLKTQKFKSFKIFTQRSKKEFALTSQEINEKVGEYILKSSKFKGNPTGSRFQRQQSSKFKAPSRLHLRFARQSLRPQVLAGGVNSQTGGQNSKIKVDLENPDIICFIEIVEKYAFLYLEKIPGLGGLPVSVSGKVVVLLSGGIDSPVAAFYIMKRGAKAIFVHFHSYPYTNKASIEKISKLIKVLNKFQFNSRLYLVPFSFIQKQILLKTPAKLRIILYRRFMFRITQEIAKKERALAIVSGESLGQVASQTLENIKVIEEAVSLPIFRPLISEDKEDIIRKAKEINTFEISILPHQDCCARFLPKHPETRAALEEVERAEKKLDIEKLNEQALKKTVFQRIYGKN